MLALLQSPPYRLMLVANQQFAGEVEQNGNGLYRDPLFITIDWVIPPANPNVPAVMDDGGDGFGDGADGFNNGPPAPGPPPRAPRAPRARGLGVPAGRVAPPDEPIARRTRSILRQAAMANQRRTLPRSARFMGSYYVGGLPKQMQAIDHRGRFLVVEEDRDVCIYPPPPPRFQLSKHAKKRQKVKNRIALTPIDSMITTRYEQVHMNT